MNAPTLMHKLMEMERALSAQDADTLRNLIFEAQDGVLALERENEHLAIENAGLRRRLDDYRRSPLQRLALQNRAAGGCHDEETPAPSVLPDDSPIEPKTPIWHMTHFFFS